MSKIIEKLAGLINVKTIVTFVILAIFTVLSLRGSFDAPAVMQIVIMVVAFYFGTQHEKQDVPPVNDWPRGEPDNAQKIGFLPPGDE